ncbi:unnamed protein product, partial [Prorocentrum cordatum]
SAQATDVPEVPPLSVMDKKIAGASEEEEFDGVERNTSKLTSIRKSWVIGEALKYVGSDPDPTEDAWPEVIDKVPFCTSCLKRLRSTYGLLGTVEAPLRTDPLSKFADGHIFETLIHVTILLNSLFMVFAADQEMAYYDQEVPEVVQVGELCFLVAYSFEFVVKLWRYHGYFFIDVDWKYNWVDVTLLVLSAYSIFFESMLPNLSWLRMMRMLRLFKVIRVLRLISMVKPLRAILKSLFETLGTLFWSLTLLALILALFALIFVMRVASYMKDEGQSLDEDAAEALLSSYSSVGVTFRHLFEATTGGNDWIVFYSPLEPTGFVNCGIFYFFVAFTQIAVLNTRR